MWTSYFRSFQRSNAQRKARTRNQVNISHIKMSLKRGLKATLVACWWQTGWLNALGGVAGARALTAMGSRATKEEIMETSRKCQRSDLLKKAERAKGLSGSAKKVTLVILRRQKVWLEFTQRAQSMTHPHKYKSSRSSRLLDPIGLIENGCWWN